MTSRWSRDFFARVLFKHKSKLNGTWCVFKFLMTQPRYDWARQAMPKQTKVKPRQAKARQIKWRQARTSRQMKINTSGICIVRNYNEHLSNWVRGWTKGRCFSYSKGNLYIQLKIKILFDIFTKLRSASNNTRYNSNLAPKLGEYNKRNKLFISLGEMSIIFRDNIAIGLLRCSWNYWPIYWLVFHWKPCRIFAETSFDLYDYYSG